MNNSNNFIDLINTNSSKIPDEFFKDNTEIKEAFIPINITEIGDKAFSGCKNLEKVQIPTSVKKIGNNAFEHCTDKKFDDITIPRSVSSIGNEAFKGCDELEKVIIEHGVSSIGKSCFEDCYSLKSISLPESIFRINEETFKGCSRLKEINLPRNLRVIDNMAFQDCAALQEIEIPDTVFEIGDSAFSNCINLKSATLPKELTKIGPFSFDFCLGLKRVNIPKNVTKIDDFAFSNCFNLKDVELPDSLKTIGESVFKNTDIEEIIIPNSVVSVGQHAFRNCKNLKEATLSNSITEILPHTFSDCSSLSKIEIPEGVKKIKTMAFADCHALEEITLPNSIEEIETDAFLDCSALRSIKIPNTIKKLGSLNSNVPYFFSTTKDGFNLTTEEYEGSIPMSSLEIDLPVLSSAWEHKDILLKEQKNKNVLEVYNTFVKNNLSKNQINEFVANHNFKFFKQLSIENPEQYENFYKLLYNLGGFDKPKEIDGKKVDYAQKVIGFIQEKLKNKSFELSQLNLPELTKMKSNGFNKEFTEFFLSNFDEIIEENINNPEFLTRCYNEFDTVQKTNTSNHGNQRRLKPTMKKFREFFNDYKFIGITSETKKIADTISPYYTDQKTFETAVEINNERIANQVPNNILGEPLKESTVFDKIDEYTNNIQTTNESLLSILTNLARKEFTYEWLEKNDPQNFILGKLCSCCSHLEGTGFGIMKASIIDPNVQNLVIKDKNGDIIAKSTLFINPDERYGVFNNVEINEEISKDDKDKIYEKFILGIKDFAQKYNSKHPKKQLKQINVGMHYNDLYSQIYSQNYPTEYILPAIKYGEKYGTEKYNYNGDSDSMQYIIWENDEFGLEK